jgi:hypothetical protein
MGSELPDSCQAVTDSRAEHWSLKATRSQKGSPKLVPSQSGTYLLLMPC